MNIKKKKFLYIKSIKIKKGKKMNPKEIKVCIQLAKCEGREKLCNHEQREKEINEA